MQREPADAVERMLLMSCNEGSNAALIFAALLGRVTVVCGAVDTQDASKSFPPSWIDFFQDS